MYFHVVYPNADSDDYFGVRHYLIGNHGEIENYSMVKLNSTDMPNRDQLYNAIDILDYDQNTIIYAPIKELNDKKLKATSFGDSKGLAYLIAVISVTKVLRQKFRTMNIWCTGQLEVNQQVANLKMVKSDNAFKRKLVNFLDQKDAPLFIVPKSNMTPDEIELCKKKKVTYLILSDFKIDMFDGTEKVVIGVPFNELKLLIETLFEPSPSVKIYRRTPCTKLSEWIINLSIYSKIICLAILLSLPTLIILLGYALDS